MVDCQDDKIIDVVEYQPPVFTRWPMEYVSGQIAQAICCHITMGCILTVHPYILTMLQVGPTKWVEDPLDNFEDPWHFIQYGYIGQRKVGEIYHPMHVNWKVKPEDKRIVKVEYLDYCRPVIIDFSSFPTEEDLITGKLDPIIIGER